MNKKIQSIEQWLTLYKLKSEGTQKAYKRTVYEFMDICGVHNEEQLKEFSMEELNIFYDYAKDKKWSENYTNNKLTIVRLLFSWLNRKHIIKENVFDDAKISAPKYVPQYFITSEDFNNLLATIEKTHTGNRLKLMVMLTVATASRKSEILNLKISDIQGHFVRIKGKGNKIVELPLSSELQNMLEQYILTERKSQIEKLETLGFEDTGYLFVSNPKKDSKAKDIRVKTSSFNDMLKSSARKANIQNWQRITVHTLKRFAICQAYEKTGDLLLCQKLGRHADSKTTSSRYISVNENKFSDMLKAIDPTQTNDKEQLINKLLEQQKEIAQQLNLLGCAI